jgi:hypothetical protein
MAGFGTRSSGCWRRERHPAEVTTRLPCRAREGNPSAPFRKFGRVFDWDAVSQANRICREKTSKDAVAIGHCILRTWTPASASDPDPWFTGVTERTDWNPKRGNRESASGPEFAAIFE